MSAEDFIKNLVNDGLDCHGWTKTKFQNDFILLSEFSELEGPKPIFTIPSRLNSDFDLNNFAVRLMSVDCVSAMQDADSFKIAGDIQVVLTELTEGAIAYVHHFVLYDICARGFVRPFCLAYVTRHRNELYGNFEQLSHLFSNVSTLYHFGNGINFINDLKIRLRNLTELKSVLDNESACDIFVEDKLLSSSQKQHISLPSVNDAMTQKHMLITTFEDYLKRDEFNEHRQYFCEQYSEILVSRGSTSSSTEVNTCNATKKSGDDTVVKKTEDCVNLTFVSSENISAMQLSGIQEDDGNDEEDCGILLNSKPYHQLPADVLSSMLGKKYDKPLRTLTELCETTFPAGLTLLKHCLNTFSRARLTPHINTLNNGDQCCQTGEARIGLTGLSMSFKAHCCEASIDEMSESNAGVECEQLSVLSVENVSFLSTLQRTSLSTPAINNPMPENSKKTGFGDILGRYHSYVNIPSYKVSAANSYVVLDSPSVLSTATNSGGNQSELWLPPLTPAADNTSGGNQSDESFDSYKDALDYHQSPMSSKSSNSSNQLSYQRQTSELSTDTVNSPLQEFKEKRSLPNVSLCSLRDKYSYLPHIVFSLLIRRPVIVLAEDRHSRQAQILIQALAGFLPQQGYEEGRVVMWSSEPLKFSNLKNYGLVGLSKSRNIPRSIQTYVSVLDYERQTLQAPKYNGRILTEMFDTQKRFKTEKSYRAFIRQIFSDLFNMALHWFLKLYVDDGNELNASDQFLSYESIFSSVSSSATSGDTLILRELLRCFVEQAEMEHDIKMASSVKITNYKCTTFNNLYSRKSKAV